jgi:small-conductance mechanosensitive channel
VSLACHSLYGVVGALAAVDIDGVTVRTIVQRLAEILLIIAAALLLSRIGARIARRSVRGLVARSVRGDQASPRATVRAETLAGVSASFIRIWIWSVAALTAFDQVGVNLGPLLAGASIVGVALGFGAQTLVRDFLSGFFVLAEDQFGVGDSVTVADITGTVEEVNLRVTRIRSFDGTIWFVPNGEIRKVGNSAKDWARAVVDVAIPSEADPALAMAAIADEISHLRDEEAWANCLLETPEVLGVETTATDSVTIRVAAKTQPTERTKVAREIRARVGNRLRREGIIPLRQPDADMQEHVEEAPAGADAPGQGP